jgi:hypothetical protein
MRRITITISGQVLTFLPGQVLFAGDRSLNLIMSAEPSALKPVKDTVVCPKCGCSIATD